MIELRRIDHVGLRVADLDEAARRWAIQFGLTEVERDGQPRLPALRLRAVLAGAGRRGRPRPRPHRAGSCAAHVSLDDAAAPPRPPRRRPRAATTGCIHLRRPGRLRHRADALPRGGRPAARRSPARPTSLPGCDPRKLGHVNVLTAGPGRARPPSTPTCWACACPTACWRRRQLALRQLRPPLDGAGQHDFAHFHHLAFEYVDWGELRVAVRPPRPARPLAGVGPAAPRAGPEPVRLRAHPRRAADRRVLLRHGAARARPRAARLAGRPPTRPTPGASCRRGRTSASTTRRSATSARACEMRGEKLPPLEVTILMATAESQSPLPPAPASSSWTGLRGDAREIWLNGEKITHPLEHPQLARGGRSRWPASTTSSTSTPTRCWRRRPTTAGWSTSPT